MNEDMNKQTAELKKGKNGWIAMITALVVVGGVYYAYDQAKRNEAHQEAWDMIELSVVKEVLDYADSDPVDTLTLVKATGDIKADVDKIDVRKVGNTKVVYTVEVLDSYGTAASKTFEHEFKVIDKEAPVIELSEDEVSFYAGDGFNESDYISSVKDPVDGDLSSVGSDEEKPTDKGWYSITSDVALDTPGNYTVKIHAEDKNGNKADKEFAVTVNERPVAATPTYDNATTYSAASDYSGYSSGYNDYSGYSGDGGSGYSDPGGNSYVAETPSETYVEPAAPAVDYSIPSGSFSSYGEANNWAMGQLSSSGVENAWGYDIDGYTTPAGVPYYIVSFKYF